MKVTIDEKAKTLTITIDMQEPALSASGKSFVVASTRGNVTVDAKVNGKNVTIGLNAYISAK